MKLIDDLKRQRPPRVQRLDGVKRKPRGKNAGKPSPPRETVTIPVGSRLGFRVTEFSALTSISVPTLWRKIKANEIKTATVGGIVLILPSNLD
jgi:hypothetical protein